MEGLSTPENYYSPFVQHYLDYPSLLRASLLWGSKGFLSLFGYVTIITDSYHLNMVGGSSVQLIYACLGVGVMSFWLAFVVANRGSWVKKLKWVLGGMMIVWCINVVRIGLVLLANNRGSRTIAGMDNHTFFNVCSYLAIFTLIYFYDRSLKKMDNR